MVGSLNQVYGWALPLALLAGCGAGPGPGQAPEEAEIAASSLALAHAVNEFRLERDLPAIPLSRSLIRVAQAHVADLAARPPAGACTTQSWSGQGAAAGSACCYTGAPGEEACLRAKPRELTGYPGAGYEVGPSGPWQQPPPDEAVVASLAGSTPHLNILLNAGEWMHLSWGAIGAAKSGAYATIWLGEERDPAGTP